MSRPQSIVNFERFYLGSAAVGLLSLVFNRGAIDAQIASTPGADSLPAWFMPASVVFGLGINLLLWYFVARRGSTVAKWIVVVFLALSATGLPAMFSAGVASLPVVFGLVGFVLNALAVWMLFRPDAAAWFKGEPPAGGDGDGNVARIVRD